MKVWSGIGRLAIRHALLAALLGVVLGVIFSVLQVRFDYLDSIEAERRDIAQMMTVMREPAAQACYNLNEQAATGIVQGALTYTHVQEVTLRSDFGEVLAQARDTRELVHPGAWWIRFFPTTQDYEMPLVYGPARMPVGQLRVVTAQAPRVERFLASAWRDVGLTVLRSVTVALALGVLSFLTLTRPLSAIARRIGHGPAAGGLPLAEAARPDEIGQIAAAFVRYEHEAGERALSLERSAQALAASEVRYRRIVETAGEGVWQVDAHGRTTLANEAMARMLGTTAERMVGMSLLDFVDSAERAVVQALLLRREGRGSERHELRFVRADGHDLWAEVSTCPIADAEGQATGTLAMVTDATERRRRDAELRATNARLTTMVHDLERHKADMAHIAELNGLLLSARTEAEAHEAIRVAASRLFVDAAGGFAVSGSGEEMAVVGSWGTPGVLPASYGRGLCWAIRRGGPHLRSGHHGIRCGHQAPDATGAMLCTPLYVDGRLIGVLHVQGPDRDAAFDGSVQQRSELFGEVVKLGLSNLRLRETLRDQAVRDVLTGLANRRLFDETLPRELARCLRADQPLTLAVIDVDHFKHYNDTYGHDAGDRVLCRVARTLTECVRESDLVSRYGGDEFMCMLPGLTAIDAKVRFERALARIAEPDDDPALATETISFTVGVATVPDCGSDLAALVRAADAALYAAKERGRGCVGVAQPSPEATPRPLVVIR